MSWPVHLFGVASFGLGQLLVGAWLFFVSSMDSILARSATTNE